MLRSNPSSWWVCDFRVFSSFPIVPPDCAIVPTGIRVVITPLAQFKKWHNRPVCPAAGQKAYLWVFYPTGFQLLVIVPPHCAITVPTGIWVVITRVGTIQKVAQSAGLSRRGTAIPNLYRPNTTCYRINTGPIPLDTGFIPLSYRSNTA